MGIGGIDDVEVSPLEGSARRRQRKLGILPLDLIGVARM